MREDPGFLLQFGRCLAEEKKAFDPMRTNWPDV